MHLFFISEMPRGSTVVSQTNQVLGARVAFPDDNLTKRKQLNVLINSMDAMLAWLYFQKKYRPVVRYFRFLCTQYPSLE